jgi:hypothetical protein
LFLRNFIVHVGLVESEIPLFEEPQDIVISRLQKFGRKRFSEIIPYDGQANRHGADEERDEDLVAVSKGTMCTSMNQYLRRYQQYQDSP